MRDRECVSLKKNYLKEAEIFAAIVYNYIVDDIFIFIIILFS